MLTRWRAKVSNGKTEWYFDVFGYTKIFALLEAESKVYEPVERGVQVKEINKKYRKLMVSVGRYATT